MTSSNIKPKLDNVWERFRELDTHDDVDDHNSPTTFLNEAWWEWLTNLPEEGLKEVREQSITSTYTRIKTGEVWHISEELNKVEPRYYKVGYGNTPKRFLKKKRKELKEGKQDD